ncbi:hypothetical protein GCM10027614_20020 [Micromonospora vulcania]
MVLDAGRGRPEHLRIPVFGRESHRPCERRMNTPNRPAPPAGSEPAERIARRVLVVSADIGGGHDATGRALEERVHALWPGAGSDGSTRWRSWGRASAVVSGAPTSPMSR